MANSKPTVSRIIYRHGMVKNPRKLKNIEESILPSDNLPNDVIESIHKTDVLSLKGTFGEPGIADPNEYEHLVIEHDDGTTEITFWNRGITVLMGDDETDRRLHRVLCHVRDAASPRD